MDKKAIISVVSKQKGNDDDIIEVVTPGKYYKKGQKYYAVYEESELSGMEGTTTILKIGQDEFTIIRKGTIDAKMVFKNEFKDHILYSTPQGALGLSMDILDVKVDVNDDGGLVYANYNLNLGEGQSLSTEINVKIKAIS
ncbi:DUF1934 domain-containing protein [Hathewaya limosa]|uniref:Uncharacterized beta-barrel protein YwiB (DUF1934 family) n=1 Tax=Hathewaya limosa TaxID=1536 RepID=A0ABU0JMU4_HATLI|nr:DUF1934 domain-containing protein [Hathewaya limosa]MDQ0478380.1 uncharacterized beta-barrel protein YwiB (DUF1934 family) [Hathewaya limosa]